MHHLLENQEKAINLSIITLYCLGEFSRVESNWAADSTPGGAFPSIPLSFGLATILPPEPNTFWFPWASEEIAFVSYQSPGGMVYS